MASESYTRATDQEVSKLPQCEKCGKRATRLDYHTCEDNNQHITKQEFIEGFEAYLQLEHIAFDTFTPGQASEIYHALQAYCEEKNINIMFTN